MAIKSIIAKIASACVLMGACSCSFFGNGDVRPVVTVGDATLYADEIIKCLPANVSGEDSSMVTESYIKNWCVEQLLYAKAKENLTNLEDIDVLVDKYRRNLMVYEYQRQLVAQHLTNPLTPAEMQKFYHDNISLYTAHETLFKGQFITIPNRNTTAISELRQQMRRAEISMGEVEQIISRHNLKVKYFDEQWTPLAAVKRLGLYKISVCHDFYGMPNYEERDDANTYILIVDDYITAGSEQPFDYVKDRLESMLIEQRKVEYLRKLAESVYNEAISDGTIKREDESKK